MNKQIQTIIIKSAAKQTQLSNLINSTVILSQETEVQISTSQGILTLHNTWTEDEGAIYSHYTYNKRTIKYKKPKPTQPKETKPMKTLATIYKGIINPITTHINNQDLTLSQLQALQQTHHTQQSLSQLPKQHLINLILDLQKQIIPVTPTTETSQPITITKPIERPIDLYEQEAKQLASAKPTTTIKYQSFKPTIEQATFIAKATISHPELFTSHYPKPSQAKSIEDYQFLITNKQLHISIIKHLTATPKKQAIQVNHLKYSKSKDLDKAINALPTNKEYIYSDKLYTSQAALKAQIKHDHAIYAIANQLSKQFNLNLQTLITRMSNSDKSPQQYKDSVLQIIAAKSKTFQDCPINLAMQHLAEHKLYLQTLNS